MLILDIGCGRKKIDGAIGIDFSPMSDADVVLDLNRERLPYADSSVDFIYSSHTLEHLSLEGFFHVMNEAYRVLKPDSQFKIIVPYFTTALNLANPFHNNNICFNEHTFRFFSSEAECDAISKNEYQTPSCPHWGLRYSANSELGIEFRTLKIDRYYFQYYEHLSDREKLSAVSSGMNVVEQISYSLMAVKPCPVRPETGPVASSEDPHSFVKEQLEYLSNQLSYLEDRGMASLPEVVHARFLQRNCRMGERDGLYCADNILTPVNFLVFELDYAIQLLRGLIDRQQVVKKPWSFKR